MSRQTWLLCRKCDFPFAFWELGLLRLLVGYRRSDRGPWEVPRHDRDRILRGQLGKRDPVQLDEVLHVMPLPYGKHWADPETGPTCPDCGPVAPMRLKVRGPVGHPGDSAWCARCGTANVLDLTPSEA